LSVKEDTLMVVILLLVALICEVLAALGVPLGNRVHLGWLGLAFMIAAMLVGPMSLLVRG
jgi:hypothetical protein